MPAIAFTYDPNLPVGQVRLLSGDTDPSSLNKTGGDRTRTDEEIGALLSLNGGNPRLAAAQLLEGKAAEYGASAIYTSDATSSSDLRSRCRRMLDTAARLREMSDEEPKFSAPAQEAPFTRGSGGSMDGW